MVNRLCIFFVIFSFQIGVYRRCNDIFLNRFAKSSTWTNLTGHSPHIHCLRLNPEKLSKYRVEDYIKKLSLKATGDFWMWTKMIWGAFVFMYWDFCCVRNIISDWNKSKSLLSPPFSILLDLIGLIQLNMN